MPLAFSPVNFYLFAVVSPAVFFYFLLYASPKRAAWLGWWFGMGFFGVGVSWVFVAIYVFGFSSIITSVLLTFFSLNVLSAFIALQGYASASLINKFQAQQKMISVIIILPVCWVLFEWFRGWFLTGFPWISLGYSQTESVLAGYASVIGVFGVSLIVALTSGLLLLLIAGYRSLSILNRTSLALGIVVLWISGFVLSSLEWTQKQGDEIKVSMVQGNVEQMTKWDPDQFEKRKQTYLTLTRQYWDSDLVLWPENSLTIFYHNLEKNFLAMLTAESKKHNTDIILGLPFLDKEKDEYFSSLMAINHSTENSQPQFYHKNHLVPFGEYVPLASLLRGMINFFDLPMSSFTPGDYNQPFLTAARQKIAPTICYEDAFGEDLIRFLPEATLVLNASNNAWYGDSFAPHQHLQISQMRALETGRDVMRVTTNGVSALINHKGEIVSRSQQFKADVVTGMVQPRTGATPYVRWGNYPVLVLLLFGLIASYVFSRK